MDKVALLDREIRQGEVLVRGLDAAGFEVVAAFWLYTEEYGNWFLFIASPEVRYGLHHALGRLQEAEAKIPEKPNLEPFSVMLVEPENKWAQALSERLDTGKTIIGKRIIHSYYDRVYFDEAWVYRAERTAA